MNADFLERLYMLEHHYNPAGRAINYAIEIIHRIGHTLDNPEAGTSSRNVSWAQIATESIKAIVIGPNYGRSPREAELFEMAQAAASKSRLEYLFCNLELLQWGLNPVRRAHFYAMDIEQRITRTLGPDWRDTGRTKLAQEIIKAIAGGRNYALNPEQIEALARPTPESHCPSVTIYDWDTGTYRDPREITFKHLQVIREAVECPECHGDVLHCDCDIPY